MSRKSSIDMPKEASSPECYTTSTSSNEISEKPGMWRNFKDSFKPPVPIDDIENGSISSTQLKGGQNVPLQQSLKKTTTDDCIRWMCGIRVISGVRSCFA